ncbi:phosphatase PAP2 family protein [Leptospira idonii]|nr:phosphatase PAP2 family protein [Leptospira idonii]
MILTSAIFAQIWFSGEPLDFLHGLDPTFGSLFFFLSVICHYLGGTVFFLVLISFAYAFYNPKLGFELATGLLTSGLVIALGKFYFESPRPFPYPEAFGEKAFGFPSGHAYSAVVVWGLLAYRFKNVWFRLLCISIILITPLTRMYLKVHYLGDVTAGFFVGLIHLGILISFLSYLDKKSLPHYFIQTDKHRTLSLLGLVLSFSVILLDSKYLSPEHHHSLATAVTAAGSIAGFWIGVLFYPKFSKHEFLNWGMPVSEGKFDLSAFGVRLSVLILVLGIFYILPSSLAQKTEWKDDLLLRYIRYLITSFALIVIYPILLQRIAGGRFLSASR